MLYKSLNYNTQVLCVCKYRKYEAHFYSHLLFPMKNVEWKHSGRTVIIFWLILTKKCVYKSAMFAAAVFHIHAETYLYVHTQTSKMIK
jgi:hypothetical protein